VYENLEYSKSNQFCKTTSKLTFLSGLDIVLEKTGGNEYIQRIAGKRKFVVDQHKPKSIREYIEKPRSKITLTGLYSSGLYSNQK
jgi:hypothetical protein